MKEEALLPDVSECISKFKLTFKNVIDSEIEALFVDTIIKFHKKGDYIYNEGARIKGCYFLFSGIVKIFQTGLPEKTRSSVSGKKEIFSGSVPLSAMKQPVLPWKPCLTVSCVISPTPL